MTSRRDFLKSIGLASLSMGGTASGLGALSGWLNTAQAAPVCGKWGDLVGNVGGWTCNNHEGYKILEIYLRFGASQWESFWLPGSAATPNYSSFDMGMPNTAPHPGNTASDSPGAFAVGDTNWNAGTTPCQAPDLPTAANNSKLFGSPSGGGNIHWGAATRPIYQRSDAVTDDVFERCRMVTQYHTLTPHEAAIPYALTGSTLGNPRLAGTGTAIQRRFQSIDPSQVLPSSYVLYSGNSGLNPQNYAAATGSHPAAARPLVIQMGNTNAFFENLARTGIESESDDLLRALRHEYRDRLRFRGAGNPVRSAGFDGYWTAAELLESAPTLQNLFADELLVLDQNVAKCADVAGVSTGTSRGIKTQLEAAAELLANGPARYVFTMDNGITGTYDTHFLPHFEQINANIYNLMAHLASVIKHPTNNPDGLIDLDDTMVVINTEFGRTPWRAYDSPTDPRGRDHWPFGYSTLLIGGPIQGGPSIQGAIDEATGRTEDNHKYSPTDIRGAMLLAAGVDPFEDANFNVASFSDALKTNPSIGTEEDIRNRLKSRILGV